MKSIYLLIIFIASSCSMIMNDSENEQNSFINGELISISEIDNKIIQFNFEKLNQIYYARLKSFSEICDERVIRQYAKKNHCSVDSIIENTYSKSFIMSNYGAFITYYKKNGRVPNIGRVVSYDNYSTEIGATRVSRMFRVTLTKHISDSLLLNSKIINNIKRPPIPTVLLNNSKIHYINNNNHSNTLIIIIDPDCISCKSSFSKIQTIVDKYYNSTSIGFILYSSSVNNEIRLLWAASEQNKFLATYKYLINNDITNSYPIINTICHDCDLDLTKIQKKLNDPNTIHLIERSFSNLSSLGISQTPTFIFNNQILSNIIDIETIDKLLER